MRLISEAEGITGMISEITLRVRPTGEPEVVLAAFDSAEGLGRFLGSLEGLELWSVSFTNPGPGARGVAGRGSAPPRRPALFFARRIW